MRQCLASTLLLLLSAILTLGCGQSDLLGRSKPDLFTPGLNARIQVDLSNSGETATVAGAVYQDGEREALVAGDVFVASSGDNYALLKNLDYNKGGYSGEVTISNTATPVLVTIQHRPTEAREDRWYPVDIVQTDPGPGRLVGRGATVNFPPAVTITAPLDDTEYAESDSIILQWETADQGDTMEAIAHIQCVDGSRNLRYGREIDLGQARFGGNQGGISDDGHASIPVDELIISETTANIFLAFAETLGRILVDTIVYALSFGLLRPDSDYSYEPFVIDYCQYDILLYRVREGLLDAEFSGGYARGSRSDLVQVIYRADL